MLTLICAALATPEPIPLKPGLTPLPGPVLLPKVPVVLAVEEAATGGRFVAAIPAGLDLAAPTVEVEAEAELAVLAELPVRAVDLPKGATPGRLPTPIAEAEIGFRAVGTNPAEAFLAVLEPRVLEAGFEATLFIG